MRGKKSRLFICGMLAACMLIEQIAIDTMSLTAYAAADTTVVSDAQGTSEDSGDGSLQVYTEGDSDTPVAEASGESSEQGTAQTETKASDESGSADASSADTGKSESGAAGTSSAAAASGDSSAANGSNKDSSASTSENAGQNAADGTSKDAANQSESATGEDDEELTDEEKAAKEKEEKEKKALEEAALKDAEKKTYKASIKVIWDDDGNLYKQRPSSLRISIADQEMELSVSDSDSETTTTVRYTSAEEATEIKLLDSLSDYNTSLDRDSEGTFIIKNTYNGEKKEITIGIKWIDEHNNTVSWPSKVYSNQAKFDLKANDDSRYETVYFSPTGSTIKRSVQKDFDCSNIEVAALDGYSTVVESDNAKENFTVNYIANNRTIDITTSWQNINGHGDRIPERCSFTYGAVEHCISASFDTYDEKGEKKTISLPDGELIEDTFSVDPIPYFESVVTRMDWGYDVEYTYSGEGAISISVKWIDYDDRWNERPDQIGLTFIPGIESEAAVTTSTISAGDNWKNDSLQDKDMPDGWGVEKKIVPQTVYNYTCSYVWFGNNKDTCTITYTHKKIKDGKLKVEWAGDEEHLDLRPSKVKVDLLDDGNIENVIASFTLTGKNEAFLDLPADFTADWIQPENVDYYAPYIYLDEETDTWVIQYQFCAANQHAVDVIWDDFNNVLNTRPDSFRLKMDGNGDSAGYYIVLSKDDAIEENKWHSLIWLTGENIYAFRRPVITDANAAALMGYTSNVTITEDENYQIELKYEGDKREQIKIQTEWKNAEGMNKPKTLSVTLDKDSTYVQKLEVPVDKGETLYAPEGLSADDITVAEIQSCDEADNYTFETRDDEYNEQGVHVFTIVGTYKTDKVNIGVQKEWVDEGHTGERSDVTVQLYIDDQPQNKYKTLTAKNNWKSAFTGLDQLSNGHEYKVEEVLSDKQEKLYKSSVKGDASSGFTITNTYIEEIPIKVIWEDDDNISGYSNTLSRPSSFNMKINFKKSDGTESSTSVTVKKPDAVEVDSIWECTFTDYDGFVKQYYKSFEVSGIPSWYEVEANYTKQDGFLINCKLKDEYEYKPLEIYTVWEGEDETVGSSQRPANIELTLSTDGRSDSAVIISATEPKNNICVSKDVYDNDKITIKASDPQPSDIENAEKYTYYVTRNEKQKQMYTVHCVYSPVKFDVVKKWKDTGHKDERPSSVQVQLYVDDVKQEGDNALITLSADNEWKGTFRLPKLTDGMSYKVKEVIPEKYEENYSSEVTGDADKGFTITNTYVEDADKKTIKITKKWEDIGHEKERPDSVTVRLYDGTSLVKDDIVLSEDNEWTATVKVTDNSASYRVEEVETTTGTDTGTDSGTTDGSETTTPTDTDTNDSAKQSADTTTSTDAGSADTGSTDQEAAPTPGTGSTDQEAAPTPGTGTTDQDAAPTPGTTTGGNLSKYQVSYSSYTPTTTGTEEGYNEELIITNTYKVEGDDYRDITITKYWDDNDNAAGLRPSSVEIKLQKKVGEQTTATDVCTVTLNADNDWKAVVRDQPLYEGTGESRQAITYNVLEVGVEDEAPAPTPTPTPTPEEGDTTTGGDTDESSEDKDAAPLSNEGNTNTTAANTAETDTGTDTQDPAPTPSGTTTGGTTTGGTTTGDDTTSGGASGGWSTPTIAAYKAFYVGSAEEGFTVINSFNLTDINIKVVWDDAGHEEIRPKQVTDIYLYKGEEQASDKLTVDESVNWAQVVPDQSVEGDFTVKAPDLEHYDRTIIGDALDGFIITYIYRDNSDETADIVIKKKWDMGDLAVALAHPDKATVQLKKGDEVIATQELSADNDWTFTMREQPLKDEKGQEIKYTVEEVGTPSGYEMSVEEVNQDAEGREIKTDGEGAESSGKDTDSQQTAGQTANGDSASAQNGIDGTGTAGAAEGSDTTQTVTTAAVAAKVFTVTNKYNGKTIHYKVEKKWDIDIEDNDRPDSIRVAIQKKNGDKWETVKVPELSKDNSWTWEGNLPDGEYRARELKEDTLFEEFETVIKNAVGTLTKDTYTSWIANIKSSGKSYWSGLPDYLKKAADKGYDYLCDSLNAKADDLYDQMMERLSFASVDGKIVDAGDDVYVDYHVPQRFSAIEGGNQDAHVTHYKVTYEESGNSCTITNEAVLEIDVIKRWIELNGAKAPDSVWVVLMMKPNSKFMDKLPGGVLDYEFPVINPIKGGNNPLALISEFTLGFGSDLLNKISGSILPKLAIAKVSKDDNWKTTFVVSKYTLGIPMEFKGAEVTSEIVRQIVKYFLKIDLPISYNPLDGYISIPTKAIPTILGITDISQITDLSGLVEKAKEKVMSMKLEDFGNLGFDTLLDAWHLMANVINIKFKIDWPDPDPVPNTIQGEKTWDDNDNAAGKRPEQVVVHLYKNGQPAKDENGNEITATISEKSGWRYTFVNCPEMDDQGNRITYTVKEDPVEGYQVTYDGYNITNKYTGVTKEDEYSNIKITKVWDDAGHDKKRPTEVVVTLKGETASGMMISAELELTAENDWSYTAEDMPLVMDGEEFTYTLTEKELSNYTAVISGSAVNGFVITNTYKDQEEETIDIPITKVWDDQGQENKRPSQITATLKKGEGDSAETVASVTLSESNNWKAVVREQPKTDAATGAEIKYTVEESAENDGLKNYDGEVTGSASEGFIITNTYKPGDGKVNVKITKQWEDLGHEDKRPDKVTATLKNGDKEVAAVELTKENNWTATVRSVQLKDILNREIEYTVEEEALENYDTAINGSAQDGFVITNVYDDNDPETIDIPITKVWDDEDNAAGVRPDSVKVTLKNNGKVIATATLNEDNDWTAVVRDQPQKDEQGNAIKYVVSEDNVPGYTHIVSGNAIDGFIVTNSYRTQKILITKEWKGDEDHTESRPDKVEVKLKVNGEEYTTVELNADNSWKATARVPMYDKDGEEIKYTVEETSVKDYKVEYGEAVKTDNGYSFAITNNYEPETKELKITKKWEDEGNTENRPSQIKVNLQANGETVDTITLRSDSASIATVAEAKASNESGNDGNSNSEDASNAADEGKATVTFGESTDTTWTCTVQDIPVRDGKGKDITYTVEEDKSGDDEEAQKLQKYSTKVEGDAESGFTITNTYDKVDITITKKWEDLGHDSERPSEVIAKLTGKGETKEVRLNAGNNWTDTVKNLPMTTADGSKITYKVEESVTCSNEADTAKLAKYKSAVTGDAQSGFTITNTYDDKDDNTIDILIKKVWEDNDNAAEKRPESVKVTLKKEGAEDVIAEATLSEENNWQVTVKDQPQQDDSGSDIKYVVSEDTTGEWAENYTTKISEVTKADAADGADADKEANENISENADKNAETHYVCTVTNTYDDNQQKITIVKKWEDEGHQDREPEEVVIKLKAGDIIARSIALDKETDWKATYTMPVKDAEGKVITYSIEENPVEDYEATYSGPITLESKDGGDDSHTLTVTNTYKQDTRKIKISKVWKDEGYESKRPAEVKINLKAGDQVVASITLPKGNVTYADGSKSDDSKAKDGDDADPDGAQDADADKEQEAGSEDQNTWTGYIDNLPIRDEEGKEIAYTVEEDKSGESEDKDKLKLEDYQTEVAGDAQNGFTVTNTYEKKITFHVEKEWDIDLEKNDCPDSIKVALQKKDGENWKTAKVVELTKDGGWKMDVEVPEGTYRARELKEDTVYDSFVETIDKVTKENYGEWINKIKEGGKSYWSSLPESIRSAADKGYDKLCDALGTKGENLREELISKLGASDADAKIIKGEGEECYVDYSVPARVSAVAGEQEAHKTRYKVSYKDEENSCKITNKAILEIDVIKRWIVPEGTELPDHVWLVLMTSPNSKFTDNLPDGMMKIEFPVVNPLKGGMNPLEMILEATIGVGSDLIAKITDGILPKLAVAKVTKDDNWRTTFVVSKYTMGIPMEFKGAEATSEIIRQIVKYFLKFDLPVSVNLLDGYISIPTKAISTIMGIEDVSDILDFSKLAGDALAKAKSLTMEDLKNLGLNTITDVGHLMANVINIKFNIPKRDPDPDPETIRGKKTWDDDNDAAKKRPETITVRLYKNGEPAKDAKGNDIVAVTSKDANWKYTFTDLADKDDEGNTITYSVREDPVEYYETTYSGYNITNKYTEKKVNEDKIDITVIKKWDDQGQQDKRPEFIEVTLTADDASVQAQTVKLTRSNDWTYTFKDLPLKNAEGKEIEYKVNEVTVEHYKTEVTGNASSGFTITNTYSNEDPETIDIPVTKVWDDIGHESERPFKITVKLMKDGAEQPLQTVELNQDNGWKTTIYGLPTKEEDGTEITYRLEEDKESLNLQNYDTSITGDMEKGFTITNTYEDNDPKTIDIPIRKVWKDDDNRASSRPESVQVTLINQNTAQEVATVKLSESNSWSAVVRDQPQYDDKGDEIKYTVSEISVPGYEVEIAGSATEGFTVTNTKSNQKITVLKKWEGDEQEKRPEKVTVTLKADGELYAMFDLCESNHWKTTMKVPIRNEKGEEIKYTVTEETVNDYVTKISEAEKTDEGYTFTITNTYKKETKNVTITKVWVDEGYDDVRPSQVRIDLKANGTVVKSLYLPEGKIVDADTSKAEETAINLKKEDNQWSGTIKDLPARDEDGKTITYTVEEDKSDTATDAEKIQKYGTEYSGNAESGFTVTNTYDQKDPETIKIPVIKIWDDNDNAADLRPEKVTIEIINKKTEEVVDTIELTKANNAANEWKGLSKELPKTGEDGTTPIEYTAKELTVEGYTTEGPTGDAQIGFTFTNKYDVRKIVIKKVWAGDEDRTDKRPKEVIVRLKADDITARTIVLSEENNWEASYSMPAMGADKTPYTYSVEEDPVEDYKTEVKEESTEDGKTITFTVTNTYEQEKQDIKITKIWKDEGFEADRPSKVKIDLKANDEVVASISLPDGEVTYTKKDDTTEGEDAGKDDTTEGEDTSKKDETAEGEDTAGSNPSTEGTGTGGTEGSDSKEPTEWTGTIQNMPVRDAQGNEISYSVTEDKTVEKDKIEKYTTEYGGDAQSGFTVTNSRSNTFTVEKKWDIDLLGNDRPDSIRVAIQKKEEEDTWKTVKVVELSSDNSWKLDVSVPEGTYRAREMQEDTALDEIIQKIDNVTKQTYGNWITSIKESGKEYWSGLPESIRSAADKGYDELCDAVGAQGEDLRTKMIELLGAAKADSKIVEAGDESYVSYHVPERTTSTEGAHQTKYLVKYEDKDNSCTITNQAILEIDVIKRWLELNGAKKPDKVVVVLLASIDQSKIAGLDTSGIELPGYLNVEVPVVSPIKGGNDIFAVLADYALGFGSDILNKISLIPKLAVAKVDESCNWRTSFVVSKYTLGLPMKYKGAELTSEIIRQVVKYWIGIDSPVSFSPFGGFISIPTKAIHTYLGIEDLEDLMDLSKLTGKALEKAKTLQLDDFKNFGFDTLKDDWHLMANVINILFKIDIPPGDPDVPPNTVVGKKTWDDNDDAAKKRPSTITVHLYKNGQPALDENGKEITATTSAAGEWRYSFTNCPSKDANGNKITYSIREDKVEWYTTIYDGMNVTNRYRESGGEEEKINITITKKWEDNDNKAKKRPTTITVNLKNGESIVGTVVLSESNNWTDTIKDLPLKDAQGKEIDYKVDEVSVPGYTTTIDGDKTSGFTITNTYEEQVSNPIKIVVITKWVDEGHEDKRPDHVTIGLYADGDKVKGDDQTASQEWTTTYENMPKFKTSTNGRLRAGAIMLTAGADAQSDLIAYSVTEDPVKNYTTVVGSAEEMDYGYRFIIVNTYTEDGGEYVPPTDPTEPDHGEYVPPNDPTEIPPSTPTTPTTVPPTPTTVIPPGGTTQVGSLQVSKVVKGSDEDKAKSFTFTVTLSLNGVPYVGTVGTEGILFDAEGKTTFTLKDGETKLIEGIPAGLTYTVTEEKADGFKVIKTGETGTIENGRVKTAQFTNVHFAGIVTNIVPKTGDTSNMMLWICLIGAAVIVMVLVTVIGRKKDKQNKK